MKQINLINRFLTGLGMLVFLLGILCIMPSQATAQSKNASGKTDKKDVSQRGVQPKKSNQQSLSNKQAPVQRVLPAEAAKQPASTKPARNSVNDKKGLPTTADKKEKALKQAKEKKEKREQNKTVKGNQVSLSNKAPQANPNQSGAQATTQSDSRSHAEKVKADWVIKREKKKNQLISQGLSKDEAEKKLQEMDKQVQSLSK